MALLFWVSLAAIAYVYVGYPCLLLAWRAVFRNSLPTAMSGRLTPAASSRLTPEDCSSGVSIVIAARNEGARLASRIENLLELDYPADRRQIVVVSDGSTDDTLQVLARYRGVVDTIAIAPGGKARALNAGVAIARHEILVFADARQAFAPDALRELVTPFQDPRIGGVTGELLLDAESELFSNRRAQSDRRRGHAGQLHASAIERRAHADRRRTVASTIADGVGMYWRYEKALRRLESTIGSTLGATGAIYAIRRALWQALPADAILDDVLTPMRVVMAGYRVVFNDGARAFDRAAMDADAEARRKVRTLAGNYQLLAIEPRLLLPWRNPVWLQFLSHKLGRLVVPYALVALFAASIALAGGAFYTTALVAQVGFYLLAGYGAVLELTARPRVEAAVAEPTSMPVREVA